MSVSFYATVAAALFCASAPAQVQNAGRLGVPSRMSEDRRTDKPYRICHPQQGMGCEDGEFCRVPEGTCDSADAVGICRPIPDACPAVDHPVCGCDGVTYGNVCEARAAGVSILHPGPCIEVCGGILGVECEDPNDFCRLRVGECCCDFQGVCVPRPQGCPDVWDPVCGCDGTTYGNKCEAGAAGVSIAFLGECGSVCRPSDDGFSCMPNACSTIPEEQCIGTVLHLDIATGAIRNLACDCLDANACHVEFGNASPFPVGECPFGQACRVIATDSDNDGIDDQFTAECVPALPGVCCLDITLGPLPYDICVDRDHESCEADGGTFHGEGTMCEPYRACCFGDLSSLCVDMNPFCCLGSGGQPQAAGSTCADPSTSNSCGRACGGVAGIPCTAANEFCDLPIGECCCDALGVCTTIPQACPDIWAPVCGCDGVTYGNPCEAAAAGVSIDHHGRCDVCCDPALEPGTNGLPLCFEGATCCADGQWRCNQGNGTPSCNAIGDVCPDLCEGFTPPGCVQTGCPDGQQCDTTVGCVPSFCSCDPLTGQIICTEDCGGGVCVPDNPPCCDPDLMPGTNGIPICFEGASCCADGRWRCNNPNGTPSCNAPGEVCREICGGITGIECSSADEFCRLPVGQCCCDNLGVCTPIPQACPDIWAPVCGCDGVTYGNPCEAAAASVSIAHEGECGGCCDPTLEPGTHGLPPCFEGATCCASGQWECNQANGTPSCNALGEVCPNLCEGFEPPGCVQTGCPDGQHCNTELFCVPSFCSCDPATGQIICTADCGGGVCVPDNPPCCDPDLMPGTNGLPICIEGATCCADGQWRCNNGDGTPSCILPGEVCPDVCGGITGIQCSAADEFCNLPVGQCCCDALGECTQIPQGCPAVWEPVCGCDGTTYGNACEAAAAGVSIDHPGPCGAICEPSPNGFGCVQMGCSAIPEERCFPTVLRLDPANGAMATVSCDCIDFNACHLEIGGGAIIAVGSCPPATGCEVVATDTNGDGVPDELRAECVPAETGACCLDISDGPIPYETCTGPSGQQSCQAQGGVFSVTEAPCEQTVACCFSFPTGGFCADIAPECCVISGGVPRGPGSTCAEVSGPNGCGQVCGGITGTQCADPGQYCNLPVGQCCCDIQGICEPIPPACPAVVNPVCGCDGVTYGNPCEAAAAGASINHLGECAP